MHGVATAANESERQGLSRYGSPQHLIGGVRAGATSSCTLIVRGGRGTAMRVAGVRSIGGRVECFELADSRQPAVGEVLLAVKAAGVGSWDDIVRTGGWDVGTRPPMALGVEAAGTIAEVGADVTGFVVGDEVMCHPLPLRDQGTWAPLLIAAAELLAPKAAAVPWDAAGAFPVPALTAHQVLTDVLAISSGQALLVHGAGGVTGGLIVQLAALRGAEVIATSSAGSTARVLDLGAQAVFDYNDPGWTRQALARWGAIPAAANAQRGGAALVQTVLADNGRLATITSDPPASERGITVLSVYVRPDGEQLTELARLLGNGKLTMHVAKHHRLDDAPNALARVTAGAVGGASVIIP
jgi:NADPH:quinone reductase-like Zn-dependent oxidoreductase